MIILYLISPIIDLFWRKCKLYSVAICTFFRPCLIYLLQANILLSKFFQDILDVRSSLRIGINFLMHIKHLVSSENENVSMKMFGSKAVIIIFGSIKEKVTRIHVSRFVIYTQGSTECTDKERIF